MPPPMSSRDTSPSKSPCKLPSLSSQPNSNPQTKERKHRRKKLCRSPSCPTRPTTNDFESPLPMEKTLINFKDPNSYVQEYDVKLPNIFKNSTPNGTDMSPETSSIGWAVKDRSRTKANLRRTESSRETTLEVLQWNQNTTKINRGRTHMRLFYCLCEHRIRGNPIKAKRRNHLPVKVRIPKGRLCP